jgi:hypothetical protein
MSSAPRRIDGAGRAMAKPSCAQKLRDRGGAFEARYTLVRKAVQFAHLARNCPLCSVDDDRRSLRLIAALHRNVVSVQSTQKAATKEHVFPRTTGHSQAVLWLQ